MSSPSVCSLRLDRYPSNVGIGARRPSLTWRYEQSPAPASSWLQERYELRLTRTTGQNSYETSSSANVEVAWPEAEPDLRSRERFTIAVRAHGVGAWTLWHEQTFVAGLLDPADWTAQFISCVEREDINQTYRPFFLRHRFTLSHEDLEHSPLLFATAAGVYELQINGQNVGRDVLSPGWQPYQHRLDYQTYEIPLGMLRAGGNVIGAKIGEGWFAGKIGRKRNNWGTRIGLMVQLDLASGKRVETDADSWQWAHGPLLSSELYDGEVYDVGLRSTEWSTDVIDKWEWHQAEAITPTIGALIASEVPPNRRLKYLEPIELITTPSGKTVLDFGQNLGGRLQVSHVPAGPGSVTFSFAEIMHKGEIDTRSNRDARATDVIRLGKTPSQNWEPSFTMHGFRYVEITGAGPSFFQLGNLVAVAIHADMEPLGHFSCSHDKITKLYNCVEWGLRGNFLSVATDCPQRDERLGWTGDITVFAPTASLMFDTRGFFASWLKGLAVEQLQDRHGVPPVESPDTWGLGMGLFPQSIWCDVVALGPFDLYRMYGETAILGEMYESMTTWLAKGVPRDDVGLWEEPIDSHQFADWCDPRSPPDDGGAAMTEPYLVANAWLVRTTWTVGQIARLLDHPEAMAYHERHKELRKQFRRRYITETGRLVSDSQSAYALSIVFDLLEPKEVDLAVARLSRLVMRGQYRISTGFAGTPFILQTLADKGLNAFAYRMLQERICPSWMNMINCGATTMWERWDSQTPKGPMPTTRAFMPSFNHFAYGSVATFLVNNVAGISPIAPGWKEILIRPRPGGTVTSAEASYLSPYGLLKVSWVVKDSMLLVDALVPPNTTARVELGFKATVVGSGSYHWDVPHEKDPQWPPKMVPASVGAAVPAQSFEP